MTLVEFFKRTAVTAALIAAMPAAALVHFSGSGVWNVDTTTSNHITPGATFSFAFDLPNPLPPSIGGIGYTTDAATGFSYTLDGVTVAEPLNDVSFYSAGAGGLFDLGFDSETISLFGGDVASTGIIHYGIYPVDIGYSGHSGEGVGTLTVAGVPEPRTWALLLIGFGLAGVTLRRARVVA